MWLVRRTLNPKRKENLALVKGVGLPKVRRPQKRYWLRTRWQCKFPLAVLPKHLNPDLEERSSDSLAHELFTCPLGMVWDLPTHCTEFPSTAIRCVTTDPGWIGIGDLAGRYSTGQMSHPILQSYCLRTRRIFFLNSSNSAAWFNYNHWSFSPDGLRRCCCCLELLQAAKPPGNRAS